MTIPPNQRAHDEETVDMVQSKSSLLIGRHFRLLFNKISGTRKTALLRKEMKMRDPAANTDTELWNENSDVRKNDPTTEVLLKLEGGINTADTVELESESDIPQVRKLEISSLDNCVKSESPNQQSTSSSASVKGEEFNLENGRTTSASERVALNSKKKDDKDESETEMYVFDEKGARVRTHSFMEYLTMTWRLLYLSAWMAATIYSIYNISLFVDRFLKRPTHTEITSKPSLEEGLALPTISICNQNRIEKIFLDMNPAVKETWESIYSSKADWDDPSIGMIGNYTYSKIYENSFGWQRSLDNCKYGIARTCYELNYPKDELFTNVVTESGKCYAFNPVGKVFSEYPGPDGSFQFLMNIHREEYLEETSQEGFIVDIHHHTNFQGSSKIEMSPGYKYKVGIKPKIRREMPIKNGGKCDPTRSITSYLAYDANSCEYECRDRYVNASCGCIISSPPNNKFNYSTCSIRRMEECGWIAFYNFLTRKENTPTSGNDRNEPLESSSHDKRHRKARRKRNIDDEGRSQDKTTTSPYSAIQTAQSGNFTTYWMTTQPTTTTHHPRAYDPASTAHLMNCSEVCPPPCEKQYYDIVVSSAKISRRYAESLAREVWVEKGREISANYSLRNHVLMEFYLVDSFTELITSVPAYDFWHLLSDIGGVMGLFLGASLFSFLAFFKATALKIYRNKKKKMPFQVFVKDILMI
ncbi:hypothetical protein ACHWQZ_G000055 [Mnemiopsis leidyi]